jgi:hypothetical protein
MGAFGKSNLFSSINNPTIPPTQNDEDLKDWSLFLNLTKLLLFKKGKRDGTYIVCSVRRNGGPGKRHNTPQRRRPHLHWCGDLTIVPLLCHKDYSNNTQREGFCLPFFVYFSWREEGQRQDRMNSCSIHSGKTNQWTTTTMTASGGDDDDDANISFGSGSGDNFLEHTDGDNAPPFKEADDDDDPPVEETTKDGSHNNNNNNQLLQEEVTAHHGRTFWYASLRDRHSCLRAEEEEEADEPPGDDSVAVVMMAQQLDRLVLTTAVSSSSSSTGSRHCRSNAVIDFGDVFVEDGGLLQQLGGEDRSLLRTDNELPTTRSSSASGNGEKAGDRRSKPRGRSSTASSSSGPPRSLHQETFWCDGWHDKWQFQEHFASHTVWF